uniref:Uncharacterized protein n=1 Tax=Schistocephalus solidus TaxID=70667 RepID=A0A0X3PTE1_SCHSO
MNSSTSGYFFQLVSLTKLFLFKVKIFFHRSVSCVVGGSLSCLARAARELPQLVKRACSPSSYLATSSQLSSPAPEPPKRPASASSRIRLSAPGRLSPPPTALHTNAPPGPPADRSAIRHAVSRLADITPVLERYGQLSNSASPSKITFFVSATFTAFYTISCISD